MRQWAKIKTTHRVLCTHTLARVEYSNIAECRRTHGVNIKLSLRRDTGWDPQRYTARIIIYDDTGVVPLG